MVLHIVYRKAWQSRTRLAMFPPPEFRFFLVTDLKQMMSQTWSQCTDEDADLWVYCQSMVHKFLETVDTWKSHSFGPYILNMAKSGQSCRTHSGVWNSAPDMQAAESVRHSVKVSSEFIESCLEREKYALFYSTKLINAALLWSGIFIFLVSN